MVFKLNDKEAEASFFGDPEIAPQPQGFPGFPGPAPRK
jgi:para-nitrobenzyl esterase